MKVYDLTVDKLDDQTGLFCVSLVDDPAVNIDFLQFNKDKKEHSHSKFKFIDEEKHIITGVALRADYPIYRYNEQYGEHFVKFSKKTIRELVEKYAKYNLYNNVNLQHNDDQYVNGDVIMIESYIVDKNRGICPHEFNNIEDGSWIVTYKINNIDLWDQIKLGKFKGFSVECMMEYNEKEPQDESIDSLINELIR